MNSKSGKREKPVVTDTTETNPAIRVRILLLKKP